ncbi:MAG TPA: DUF1192 domain-containing protein [Caulobacteraceae bacterium]|nr:DUF1192 domain-containing protein [Caulobacteraceae bacterium]
MLDESLPRQARGAALVEARKEDLELYGAEELRERIEHLEAEIERTRKALDSREAKRSAADALFSFKTS